MLSLKGGGQESSRDYQQSGSVRQRFHQLGIRGRSRSCKIIGNACQVERRQYSEVLEEWFGCRRRGLFP